jgi:TolB-like protein/Tfp pilus assembly protein PilF
VSQRNFFAELKRRNVYKVGAAYVVIGWLLIQIATQVFPFFEIPNWGVRLVVLAIVLGFPIALVIAWAFELTPEGIKRTDSEVLEPVRRRGGRMWIFVVSAAGLLSLALFFLGRYTAGPERAVSPGGAKSIAVLPFENRSEEKANAYFADGIQDEILTRLAKIEDLKVISRTSTQRYKSSPENLRDIAKQLGVEHVVEGSVQKAGEQVRVNVQLINALSDAHLWAEVYDRKIADIFAVQSEIAETIAKALQVKLSSREKQAVAAKPTENPAAYDAYLRGLAIWNSLDVSPQASQAMEEFFGRAVQLDPQFAVAWASLSLIHTLSYAEYDPTTGRLAEAKRALDTAFRLQPTLGDAHFALGLYRYRGLRDYDGALKAFDEAIEHGVNKAMSIEFSAYVKRRQGKWDEALALHEQAIQLDPRNHVIYSERASSFHTLRRFAEARTMIDRALEITPGAPVLLAQKARTFQAEANFEAAESLIGHVPFDAQQPELIWTRYRQWICTRRFADAIVALEGVLASSESLPKNLVASYRAGLGFAKRLAGDVEGSQRDLSRARDELERLREQSHKGEGFLESLIVVDALLGDRARVEANIARLPAEVMNDAFYSPEVEQEVARARARLGDADAAIAILGRLLNKPGVTTCGLLRVDPTWDSLRSDVRFQKLCEDQKR